MPAAQLRPLGFGEILDGAFTLYRRHFGSLFLTMLLAYAPLIVFWTLVSFGISRSGPDEGTVLFGFASLLTIPYSLLVVPLAWGALIQETSEAYTDGMVSAGAGYRQAFRRWIPLVIATVISVVLFFLGLVLFVVPGILVAAMLFAVWPAVVIEEKGAFASLGRSRELARGGWGRILGILLVVSLIVALPSFALYALAGVGMAVTGPDSLTALESPWLNAVSQVITALITSLTTPFFAASLVLLYYDRRVHTEGLDLELATAELATSV